MKSLANIFEDLVYHLQPHDNTPRSWRDLHDYEWWTRHPNQHPDIIQMAQKRDEHQSPAGPHQTTASRTEVLNYLGQLAKEYQLPVKLVYAVADAESDVNANKPPQPNYERGQHGNIKRDAQGNPKIVSWDYGLMQVNSSNIYHVDAKGRERGVVRDAHGKPFKIGEDIKTDWKANARAGVALLAPAYRLAEMEQGPGATAEDNAQQTYSQYNSGNTKMRERYLKERRGGLPENGADRNFVQKYRQWPN